MTERVDICNLALSWLGEDEITSIEDPSSRALQLKINYIPARDATLEAHEWSFAIERFIPGKLAAAPAFGVANGNTYWNGRIGGQEQLDWVMENSLILCNEEVIYCRGLRRVEQEGRFSPLFVHALAAKLAGLIALNLTASKEIQANMFGLYAGFIKEAKTRDGMQGRSKRIRDRTLLKSR